MKLSKLPLIVGASLFLTVAHADDQKADSKPAAQQTAPAKSDGQIELVVSGMT
jgi:hypothetical protein